ncbi:MAG: hypothetical protein COA79_18640 [Planctomycetota bacterium]|nr:MAG: hypothetical protein COA79_18640 [Planctomycetota bacterium]
MSDDNSQNKNEDKTPVEQNEEFKALGLEKEVLEKVSEVGYEHPSEIQVEVIPALLEGQDVIGKAKTGSGKTAAFLLPVIQRVLKGEIKKVVIIAPTRELSLQIFEELKILGPKGITGVSLVGGKDMGKQLKGLAKPHQFIIATTGRLLDLVGKGKVATNDIEMVILDEADRLLDMGFLDDTREILSHFTNIKNTALFSATFDGKIMNLADQLLINPKFIDIKEETTIDLSTFEQYYIAVNITRKRALMYTIIKDQQPDKCLLFCRTKNQCKILHEKLITKDYEVGQIHGDLPQYKRDKVLQDFKSGKFKYLVATDVASRGLHIDGITHVINFDLPDEVEDYIHRVGRTARMGESGKAFSFVTRADGETFSKIEKGINMQIPEFIIEDFFTALDENGNEIDRRNSNFGKDEGKEEEKVPVIKEPESASDINENSADGSYAFGKTSFETPKGFGQGL